MSWFFSLVATKIQREISEFLLHLLISCVEKHRFGPASGQEN
jgi:hypothetical protein